MDVNFEDVLSYIENANDYEINDIMAVVRKRYVLHYPDWDILYLSCPKNDPEARKQTLAYIQSYFQHNNQHK